VREVKTVYLPGLPPKGDLWDWIEAGGTHEQIQAIVEKAAAFQMPTAPPPHPEPGPAKGAAADNPTLRGERGTIYSGRLHSNHGGP
jgi:hypothetical protein